MLGLASDELDWARVTCSSSVPFSSREEHILSALKKKVRTTAALSASG